VIEADIPGMAAFGPCIRAGEFLLPSGLMAIGGNGHVAGKTISSDFPGLVHSGYSQACAVYDYAEALSRAAGTSMTKLLRAQYFTDDSAAFPGVAMAWAERYGRQAHPFVCVQTPSPMPAPGAALIADFWISTLS
jgi:enamine deaminase RidA (YjgF/YER057c/UK114 family)